MGFNQSTLFVQIHCPRDWMFWVAERSYSGICRLAGFYRGSSQMGWLPVHSLRNECICLIRVVSDWLTMPQSGAVWECQSPADVLMRWPQYAMNMEWRRWDLAVWLLRIRSSWSHSIWMAAKLHLFGQQIWNYPLWSWDWSLSYIVMRRIIFWFCWPSFGQTMTFCVVCRRQTLQKSPSNDSDTDCVHKSVVRYGSLLGHCEIVGFCTNEWKFVISFGYKEDDDQWS